MCLIPFKLAQFSLSKKKKKKGINWDEVKGQRHLQLYDQDKTVSLKVSVDAYGDVWLTVASLQIIQDDAAHVFRGHGGDKTQSATFESSKIFVPEWDSREEVTDLCSQGSDEGIEEEQLSLSLETNRREFVGRFQFVFEGWVWNDFFLILQIR